MMADRSGSRKKEQAKLPGSWEDLVALVESTSRMPKARRIRLLVRACGDPEELVRVAAVEQITAPLIPTLRPALYSALSDRSELVRVRAALALGKLGGSRDVHVLASHARSARGSFGLAVLASLAHLGKADAGDALMHRLGRVQDYRAACVGIRVLCDIPHSADRRDCVRAVVKQLKERFRSRAVDDAASEGLAALALISRR